MIVTHNINLFIYLTSNSSKIKPTLRVILDLISSNLKDSRISLSHHRFHDCHSMTKVLIHRQDSQKIITSTRMKLKQ